MSEKAVVHLCSSCHSKLTCLQCRGEKREREVRPAYGTGASAARRYSSPQVAALSTQPLTLYAGKSNRETFCPCCKRELICLQCLRQGGFAMKKREAPHATTVAAARKREPSAFQLQQMASIGARPPPQQHPAMEMHETSFKHEMPLPSERQQPPIPLPRRGQVIKFLITGKSGTSKSVIINGLVGQELIPERKGIVSKPRSDRLEFYFCSLGTSRVQVWSSPHLQDEDKRINVDEYCEDLKSSCHDVDLIIYCLNMTETRFLPGNPDILAMEKLTQIFGPDCWRKAIFALTFANLAAAGPFSAGIGEPKEVQVKAFRSGLSAWQKIIQDSLVNYANVPADIPVKVVPAGHYCRPGLPDRESWLADLFLECISSMPSRVQEAMIKGNLSRLQNVQSFRPENSRGKKIHNQQITIFDSFMQKYPSLMDFISKALHW